MKLKEMYENIIVMFYLILLIIVTVAIILYSRDIYEDVDSRNTEFENLEIAMSYVNVKIRQNDKQGAITVKPFSVTNENAIVITHKDYDTWIYQLDNELVESTSESGVEPTTKDFIDISEISEFEVTMEDNLISYSIAINDDLEDSSAIFINSDL